MATQNVTIASLRFDVYGSHISKPESRLAFVTRCVRQQRRGTDQRCSKGRKGSGHRADDETQPGGYPQRLARLDHDHRHLACTPTPAPQTNQGPAAPRGALFL